MPRMAMPQMTLMSERMAIGKPENGVSMTMMPSRMSVLVRDMRKVYQGVTMTTNSPRMASGWAVK